jgi:hypothetical protein
MTLLDAPDLRLPPAGYAGRELDVDDLRGLAETVAGREALWLPCVDRQAADRDYASLHADAFVGIWVIWWLPGSDTGWHDHAGSRGAVAVAEGRIREERPVWGGAPRRIDAQPGDSFGFDETEIHRMVNVSDALAVTIHAYSLPLARMGMYRIGDDGYLRRRDVDWDEKLRA